MRRRDFMIPVIACLAIFPLSGCGPSKTAKMASESVRLAEVIRTDAAQYVTDWNSHDAMKVIGHLDTDGLGMFHGVQNAQGPAANLGLVRQLLTDNPNLSLVVENPTAQVETGGRSGIFRASYTLTLTDRKAGRPYTETGNLIAGYKAQSDGGAKMSWVVFSDTSSDLSSNR